MLFQENIQAFQEILSKYNMPYDLKQLPDGIQFFNIEDKTKNGGCPFRLIIAFQPEKEQVDIHGFILAPIRPEVDKFATYELLNTLNQKYRFIKFSLNNENIITLSSSLEFDGNFKGDIVAKHLVMIHNATNAEFQEIAKTALQS